MTTMRLPTLLMVAVLAIPGAAYAAIKCWTNSEGVRECGNVVPPEYAQKGHDELSKRGMKTREVEAAKTPEEMAAERREREHQEAQERLSREQAARDRVLLRTYTSSRELDLALEDKLAVLESRINLTRNHIEKFEQNLELLHAKAAREERAGGGVSDKVEEDIAQVERQIEKSEEFVVDREHEKAELRQQYAADKERFEKLKSGAIQPGDISHLTPGEAPAGN
ncbi:MAG: hypothetical protein U5S82_09725 [Gammaproteobacteria bacterium]|nr:hypothetical protein [Gammaproteobacteria bacterium]